MEVGVYALFVTLYFFVVLRYCAGWLLELFHHDRPVYAIVAVSLMVGQGLVLERLTTWLLRCMRRQNA